MLRGKPDRTALQGKTPASRAHVSQILPFAEVSCRATFRTGGRLPSFRGPTLRGGLGFHLKRAVCHVRASRCEDCIVRGTCAYSYVFEGVPPEGRTFMQLYPNVPQPFVMLTRFDEPEDVEPGGELEFGLRLFGRAIELFPYVAYSLIELGKEGLGRGRIKFDIQEINQPSQSIAVFRRSSNKLGTLKKEVVRIDGSPAGTGHITIEFVTPLRLRVAGREARKVSFSDLIRAAVRRLSIMTQFYGLPLADALDTSQLLSGCEAVEVVEDNTQWFEFRRYSGRQKRRVPMGGLIGSMTFVGNLSKYLPLLELAQVTNLGKATSFGFGRFKVSSDDKLGIGE